MLLLLLPCCHEDRLSVYTDVFLVFRPSFAVFDCLQTPLLLQEFFFNRLGVFAIFCKLGTFSTLILRYVYAADIAASFLSCFFRLSLGSTMLSSTWGWNGFRLRISIINFGVVRLYSHSFWGFTCLISLDGVYVFHFAFCLLSLVF